MSHSPKQYSQIFLSFLERTPASEHKKFIRSFAELLEENNDLKNEDEILFAIEQALYHHQNKIKVEVTERKSNSVSVPKKIAGKDTEVRNMIDPVVLGGLRIKIGDTVIDNSLQTRIKNLKNALTKN